MSEIAAYHDTDYIRGKAPITKREIRILTIALLGIEPGDVVVDIGAGTGGLTMEAAHAAYKGQVWAVEGSEVAQELVTRNAEAFDAQNVTLAAGYAPEALDAVPQTVDKVILGGTGGAMTEILEWCAAHLKDGGRLVANFITLENAVTAKTWLDGHFGQVEMIQVGVSRGEKIGGLTMMKAQNPIFILTAAKAQPED
jgi:cobalt-precorrin-6B (C15)-methyltransferase